VLLGGLDGFGEQNRAGGPFEDSPAFSFAAGGERDGFFLPEPVQGTPLRIAFTKSAGKASPKGNNGPLPIVSRPGLV
jgi:hypothetical protein